MLRRRVGKKLKRERDSSRSELYEKDLMSVGSASTNVDRHSTPVLYPSSDASARRWAKSVGSKGRLSRGNDRANACTRIIHAEQG